MADEIAERVGATGPALTWADDELELLDVDSADTVGEAVAEVTLDVLAVGANVELVLAWLFDDRVGAGAAVADAVGSLLKVGRPAVSVADVPAEGFVTELDVAGADSLVDVGGSVGTGSTLALAVGTGTSLIDETDGADEDSDEETLGSDVAEVVAEDSEAAGEDSEELALGSGVAAIRFERKTKP